MSQQDNSVEVVDNNGWRKKYPLPLKPIVHLGSHAENDIVLVSEHGGGVEPLHAQIIAPTSQRAGFRLVNLSETVITLGAGGQGVLSARGSVSIGDGTTFRLGDFTLIFHGEGGYSGGPSLGSSRHIGVRLQFSHTTLAPDEAIEGTVTIRNLGELTGVQFEVELAGLEEACFDLEPGPLLSSGAEKNVALRLHHRGALPPAGDLQIVIRVTAPTSYPGEQVSVTQMIEVLPMFRHKMSLLTTSKEAQLPQVSEEERLTAKSKPSQRRRAASQATQPADDWWAAPAVGAGSAAAARADLAQTPQVYQSAPSTQPQGGNWWGTPTTAADATATPSAVEAEAAGWWDTPAQESTPIQSAPAAAAQSPPAAAEPEAADWWAAPSDTTNDATPGAAPTAPPVDETNDASSQVDDWWTAAAAESAPAPSPAGPAIPDTANVPRQADDWWSTPQEAEVPTAPAIPDTADVPRQVDDRAPASAAVAETPPEDSGIRNEWWATATEPAPDIAATPAAVETEETDDKDSGAAALAGAAAVSAAAGAAIAAGAVRKSQKQEETGAADSTPDSTSANDETIVSAPATRKAAAPVPSPSSKPIPPPPAEPEPPSAAAIEPGSAETEAAIASVPRPAEPDEAGAVSVWGKTKQWGMGLAVTLPFIGDRLRDDTEETSSTEGTVSETAPAGVAATEQPPEAKSATPTLDATTQPDAPDIGAAAAIDEPESPQTEAIIAPAAADEPEPSQAEVTSASETDEKTLVAVSPPPVDDDSPTYEAMPADDATAPETAQVEPAKVESSDRPETEAAQTGAAAAATDDWWTDAWAMPEPSVAAGEKQTAPSQPAAGQDSTNDLPSKPQTEIIEPDQTEITRIAGSPRPDEPDNAPTDDTAGTEEMTSPAAETEAAELKPVEHKPESPEQPPGFEAARPDPGSLTHWGQKEAWQPLIPGDPQLNPEDWWSDDLDLADQSDSATAVDSTDTSDTVADSDESFKEEG